MRYGTDGALSDNRLQYMARTVGGGSGLAQSRSVECPTRTARSAILTVASVSAGEIDVVEGVNDQTPNQSTLHTNAGEFASCRSLCAVLGLTSHAARLHRPCFAVADGVSSVDQYWG